MQKFNEWLKNKILKEEQLKDAIQNGQDWKCPNCEKPLTENELSKSVCSGCWKTFMPRNLTWYGLGKPEVRNPYSPTMPLGSRTWQKTTDMFYNEPVNPRDANRIGGV